MAAHDHLLLALALMIILASLAPLIKKIGLPTVIGEITVGIILALLAHYFSALQWLIHDNTIDFFAELGSILLLFEIGLESQLQELMAVGIYGFGVAVLGVIMPIGLTWLVGKEILAIDNINCLLFLGATLSATSTGIAIRVFKDFNLIKTLACRIVLSASIIDDLLCLIILTIVSGLTLSHQLNFYALQLTAIHIIYFFIIILVICRILIPIVIRNLLHINSQSTVAILSAFCLICSWLASQFGLASIIGGFMAGLILEPKWFANNNPRLSHVDFNNLLQPVMQIFVPIFFIYVGMQVDILALLNWHVLYIGFLIGVIAICSKLGCGFFLPQNIRWLVGLGMVARGEVGLIFALTGLELGVFNAEIFAEIVVMVIITSIFSPLALQYIIKKNIIY